MYDSTKAKQTGYKYKLFVNIDKNITSRLDVNQLCDMFENTATTNETFKDILNGFDFNEK